MFRKFRSIVLIFFIPFVLIFEGLRKVLKHLRRFLSLLGHERIISHYKRSKFNPYEEANKMGYYICLDPYEAEKYITIPLPNPSSINDVKSYWAKSFIDYPKERAPKGKQWKLFTGKNEGVNFADGMPEWRLVDESN